MAEEEVKGSVDALAFPLLAQGHIIPFMRLCELLASKDLNVVFLTTPLNAKRLKAKRNAVSSSLVRVMDIALPSVPGLPDGTENTEKLTPLQISTLFTGIEQMEISFTQLVARLRPKCLIADFCPFFLPAVADQLKIPVFFYVTMGAYGLSMIEAVINSLPLLIPADSPPTVFLPGFPKRVPIHDSDMLHPFRGAGRTGMPHDLFFKFFEHIRRSQGVIMNAFDEMEGEFVDHVQSSFGVPVWSIGPVLSSPSGDFEEGGVEEWLDRRASGSVVYANFGSEIALSGDQTKVVAEGLEASRQCFLWAVKNPPGDEPLFHLLHGFRQRTADCGLVVTGWAPQQAILSHPSIGGFLSHCGWNSTLESISNGIPILAWPFQNDQPFVKKLLVEELRVAEEVKMEAMGNGVFTVTSAEIERGVKLIIEGKEGKDMRMRACELKEAAIHAVGEGGSSFTNLEKIVSLIHNIPTK
ncbi:UDP-glycosyltransferase 73C3 [Cryptomeria japonica]|uniref:UDP-glycosyltransferase 73C3 n=1 Tax=Cryptomeria japonica TaxID=3369 RepID=UPI0027DA373A|nr:UDP-glycosyltransferase 73C3 [Cryptomeria japonica]